MNNSDKLRLGFVSDGKLLVKFAFVYGQTSEVIVGRSANAQICINHNVISSQHAQLIYDANGNFISNNLESYECPWNFSVNYGLNVGYKFLLSEVFIIDCSLGYQGSTLPDFENNQALTQRKADWDNGIAFPVNFQWSLGFFIE